MGPPEGTQCRENRTRYCAETATFSGSKFPPNCAGRASLKTSSVAEARKLRSAELALWKERFDQERGQLDLKLVSKFGLQAHVQANGDEGNGDSVRSNEAMQRIHHWDVPLLRS